MSAHLVPQLPQLEVEHLLGQRFPVKVMEVVAQYALSM